MPAREGDLNVLFLGQKPIGQRAFRMVLESPCAFPVGAVSNVSTDNWWGDNEIHRICQGRGIAFVDNARRNNDQILHLIEEHHVQCLLSIQHGWILPARLIDAVDGFAFNLHLAPLPRYKGWHSANHSILEGRSEFGVSLHWLSAEVDAGDMAFEERFPIEGTDTAFSIYRRAEVLGLELFAQLLHTLEAGEVPPRVRLSGESGFYRPEDLDEFREVTLDMSAEEISRRARACFFPPFEPAFVRLSDGRYFIMPESQDDRAGVARP